MTGRDTALVVSVPPAGETARNVVLASTRTAKVAAQRGPVDRIDILDRHRSAIRLSVASTQGVMEAARRTFRPAGTLDRDAWSLTVFPGP